MLTFKLKVAGKGKKIGVAKWKLDAFTFQNKIDLVSTVVKKKEGAPRLVVCRSAAVCIHLMAYSATLWTTQP